MREIHTIVEFDAYLSEHRNLDGLVAQGVDLSERSAEIETVSCAGGTFLGARLSTSTLEHVLDGWVPEDVDSFGRDALDSKIYEWTARHGKGVNMPVLDALAQRLHDHAIDNALTEHLAAHVDVVAVT